MSISNAAGYAEAHYHRCLEHLIFLYVSNERKFLKFGLDPTRARTKRLNEWLKSHVKNAEFACDVEKSMTQIDDYIKTRRPPSSEGGIAQTARPFALHNWNGDSYIVPFDEQVTALRLLHWNIATSWHPKDINFLASQNVEEKNWYHDWSRLEPVSGTWAEYQESHSNSPLTDLEDPDRVAKPWVLVEEVASSISDPGPDILGLHEADPDKTHWMHTDHVKRFMIALVDGIMNSGTWRSLGLSPGTSADLQVIFALKVWEILKYRGMPSNTLMDTLWNYR
ncbi:Uu.00g127480.m01.CDS01 [Anthostomella pinea]|uniref:Uu.00g127480.m01.CDS01 n=1 Tax=Anthostomella pinea TaxID=933095 RepID=A0AAI8YHW1_9PEZI|nr:Uu.00g127480.m01.CDS01 [Anthostomella pinea]